MCIASGSAAIVAAFAPARALAQDTMPNPAAQAAVREAGARLPQAGEPLRLPELVRLDGSPYGEAQARGKVLLVYWWASWCPFCAATSPHIETLWRTQRARGLDVLALSIDRRQSDARAYLDRRGYTFPAAMLTAEAARMLPKPRGLPVSVLRGREGKVVFSEAGELFPETVEGLKQYL